MSGAPRIPRLLNHCETQGSVLLCCIFDHLVDVDIKWSQEKQNKTGGWTFSSEEDHQSGGSDGGH
jgi:hypothetical protein